MNESIKESDWQLFRTINPAALDRYCKESLEGVSNLLKDADVNSCDKTFKIFDYMKSRRKLQSDLFGDYRRSTAEFQLIRMARVGVLKESEINSLSEELRDKIKTVLSL